MGGCQAGKAQRKCEHGPGNRPGPLLFLKFSIILGQINKRYFGSETCFGAAELVRAQVAGGRGRRFDSRAPQVLIFLPEIRLRRGTGGARWVS